METVKNKLGRTIPVYTRYEISESFKVINDVKNKDNTRNYLIFLYRTLNSMGILEKFNNLHKTNVHNMPHEYDTRIILDDLSSYDIVEISEYLAENELGMLSPYGKKYRMSEYYDNGWR